MLLDTAKGCEYCSKHTQLIDEMEQELIVLRTRNRIITAVNSALRERVTKLQQQSDVLAEMLANQDSDLDFLGTVTT